jgi:hypothetical protein
MNPHPQSALHQALDVSRRLAAAAESGDSAAAMQMNAERMRLLKEARRALQPVDATDREILAEIADLNQRAIGALQHGLRRTARQLDMLSVGRRAVRAYSATRSRF